MKHEVSTESLSSALDELDAVNKKIQGNEVAVFLDYDGTLTPIVSRPEDARLSEDMRQTVRELARHYTVAIISGRDRKDLRDRVKVEGIYYAGSHGFDIIGPQNLKKVLPEAQALLPVLEEVEQSLQEIVRRFKGSQIERKKFSIAMHYRNVAPQEQEDVIQHVQEKSEDYQNIKLRHGKKVLELLPAIDWDKGKALLWLLEKMPLHGNDIVSIYIGDDLTDEDAFRVLDENSFGIVVRHENRKTLADFAVESTGEVQAFLHELIKTGG